MSTSTIPLAHGVANEEWSLPYHGTVAMLALIVAETAIFSIFVVAYIYYIGKSISGPQPRQVLELPIFNTVCLLSSSFTIWLAERALKKNSMGAFSLWWGITSCWARSFSRYRARMEKAHLSGRADHQHQPVWHDVSTRWSACMRATSSSV